MFTKWESLTAKLYDISCSRNGKFYQQNSTIFHVCEVEKFNWRDLRYFMSSKWKRLTGQLDDNSCPQSEKFSWRTFLYFMSKKWKTLAGELYYISCPRSRKV